MKLASFDKNELKVPSKALLNGELCGYKLSEEARNELLKQLVGTKVFLGQGDGNPRPVKEVVGEVTFVEAGEVGIAFMANRAQLISELMGKGLAAKINSIGVTTPGTDGERVVIAFKAIFSVDLVAESPDIPEV
jgi:hypothetical protein